MRLASRCAADGVLCASVGMYANPIASSLVPPHLVSRCSARSNEICAPTPRPSTVVAAFYGDGLGCVRVSGCVWCVRVWLLEPEGENQFPKAGMEFDWLRNPKDLAVFAQCDHAHVR